MVVINQRATGAQRHQVPPELRQFVQTRCDDVESISRFNDDCETFRRGWTIKAKTVRPRHLPDGYAVGNASGSINEGMARVQVVEVLD
jgi:hypothetical protein